MPATPVVREFIEGSLRGQDPRKQGNAPPSFVPARLRLSRSTAATAVPEGRRCSPIETTPVPCRDDGWYLPRRSCMLVGSAARGDLSWRGGERLGCEPWQGP
jgi:hypothetical protein